MTSIAFAYNKRWLAIAADSAGSLPNGKVFSANKIYRLSSKYPIGIATYWSSVVWEMPCELIAKLFRQSYWWEEFETVEQCFEKFKEFITTFDKINDIPENIVINLLRQSVIEYENAPGESVEEKRSFVTSALESMNLESYFQDDEVDMLLGIYDSLLDTVFWNYLDIKQDLKQIVKICLQKKVPIWLTWFVIFWFWEKDVYPRMHSIKILSKLNWTLHYIDAEEINSQQIWWHGIFPFAQSDAILTFLTGISPGIDWYLTNLDNSSIFDNIDQATLDKIAVVSEKKLRQIEKR